MPLNFFSKKTKDQDPISHSFLCLMLVEDRVQAAMWQVENKKVKLSTQSVIHRYENNEDGLIKMDEALQELGPDSEKLSEVVFGFDPQWIGDSGLKKTHKAFIKELTQSLQLAPIGFVVVTDALVQQLINESPLDSSVVVYIQEKHAYLLLIKQGKLINSLSVGRSDNIVKDIVEGLARFKRSSKDKDSYLPAKVELASLVMSPAELIETQQAVLGYDWADNHPFLQAPVIEVLEPVKILQAVVYQGGSAVAKSKGLEIDDGKPKGEGGRPETALNIGMGVDGGGKPGDAFGFEEVPVKGDNFGPVDGNRVAGKPVATSFGIPMNEDKLWKSKHDSTRLDSGKPDQDFGKARTTFESQANNKNKRKRKRKFPKMFSWLKNHPHKNMIIGGMVGGLIALMATFVFGTLATYKAELLITPDQKTISKEVAIILDSKAKESDPENLILKAVVKEKEVTGNDAVETTGVKLVGDRATGSITIFNKTTSEKTFEKGTSFSTQGRSFTLNEEVEVASASDQTSSREYGKVDAIVTAAEIGDEGNINKDTELKAASYDTDTYSAIVKDSFTGGSSREIRVVAKVDRDTLLKTLKQDLIKKGEEEFGQDSGNGQYYAVTGESTVILTEFNYDIGDETDNLTLDLVIEVEAVAYESDDMRPLIVAALGDEIPDGYELLAEDPEILSSPSDDATNGAKVVLDANIRAKVGPKLDLNELIKEVLGLQLTEVIGRLQQKSTIKKVDYQLKPGYASWFIKKLPNTAERVEVKLEL